MSQSDIMVSVCCITYNQEKYIAEALESFLMQKTNFKYEIVIGEDCSTDSTKQIIEDYSLKYPGMIRLISDKVNVGSVKNQLRTLKQSKGKYIAMCDGDDYWTDPLKLQKQVDFMESKQDCLICCTYTRVIDENRELVYENTSPVKLEHSYDDVLLGKKDETRICSLMMKNSLRINQISFQDWYYHTYSADTFLKLYLLAPQNGKIYVLPEVMAVYRLHKDGIWSMIDARVRKGKMVNDFNILINNFTYSAQNKKELLKIYIMQFLLFDIRNFKLKNALNTLITLV